MTSIYQVDSFTSEPFKGNPAAVCVLDNFDKEKHTDRWYADVAAEMNLSETAFLVPAKGGYSLRWFTPTVEVDLCGHATLASAHILRETGRIPENQTVKFETRSGELTAGFDRDKIVLDFPATPALECNAPPELLDALQVDSLFCGKTSFDYLIRVASEAVVRACRPDMAKLSEFGVRGAIVTATSDDERFDFVSRYFAPGVGIDEDPVTGSAHCALAPFWHPVFNKTSMIAYQASKRGGIVEMEIRKDRVILSGNAVTIMKCEFMV